MSYQQPVSDAGSAKGGPERGKADRGGAKRQKGRRDVSTLLATARKKYDEDRIKGAIELLKRALKADRGNAVATAWLALCYMRQSRLAEGEKLMRRALEADPLSAEVLCVYAKALHGRGRLNEAANTYSRALELDPQNGDIYRDLAILLIDARVLDQATEALVMAVRLNPQDAMAFYHLGLIKAMQGRDGEAIEAYSMAVAIKPDYAQAHVNLAKIAIDHKKYALGEKSCLKAIEADPKLPYAYVNLCMLKRSQKQLEDAVRYGKKAAELAPMNGAAHSNLGNAYMDMHRYDQALSCFRKAMDFEPSFATSYFNCGNALRLLHDLDKANVHYDKAIELEPGNGEYFHNQGLVYREQGRLEEALAYFRESVRLAPENLRRQFTLGRQLRREGLLEEAWKYYDAGLEAGNRKPNRKFRVPRWCGEDISDKRILVWREQGVGDEIDFARHYRDIVEAAGETVIEADERLLPIFQRSFPQARLLAEKQDARADLERDDCDLHLPAGNLLQYFPFTDDELALAHYPEDDIEAALLCAERSRKVEGYLLPDPKRVEEMADRCASLPEGLKVGICWRSQLSHRDRETQYTRLEMWEPVFKVPGLVFVNLFYEECEEEIAEAEERFGIEIHRWPDIDLKNDMEAAFALTSQVDLMLSTSTSPRRIAEALGKEVWVMSAGGSRPLQPPIGECGVPNHMRWRRHWKEPWPVLMERMARALEVRVKER